MTADPTLRPSGGDMGTCQYQERQALPPGAICVLSGYGVSMQDQYNLVQREEEREMFGLLADQGVGSIPWSPLAGGLVARPWGHFD